MIGLTSVEISICFPQVEILNLFPPQVEMLVDLEEANTVEPVVATRKPVLERPTEEVLHQSLPFMLIIKVYYIILLITHGTYLPYTSRLISA